MALKGSLHPPQPYQGQLQDIVEAIQRYLHLPDPAPAVLVLGSAAAHLVEGCPIWTMIVGPPSSGKSDLLYFISSMESAFMISTLTEAALLSGSGKKDKTARSTGGLLRQIDGQGSRGLLVAKDFTSVLNMNRDNRASVLAALREIYDGKWVRHVGSDGGQQLVWEGQVGFLGAVTDAIDAHSSVISSMGDRFLYCRMDPADQSVVGDVVLDRSGDRDIVRMGLRQMILEFILGGLNKEAMVRKLFAKEREWLKASATVACLGRSAVLRNFRNEIEEVLEPESIARLLGSLSHLYRVLEGLGCSRQEAQRIIEKAALDCIPRKRVRLMHLLGMEGELQADEMRKDRMTDHPSITIRRCLEDMECLRIVQRRGRGVKGDPDNWSLQPEFGKLWKSLGISESYWGC